MTDPEEIWNLLHDGGITGVKGSVPGDLTIRVEIGYLTNLMQPPCEALLVTLLNCETFEYLHWQDDHRTRDVGILKTLEPEILSASATTQGVQVICSSGQFDICYGGVAVGREDGTPTSIAELEEVATAYWNAFGSKRGV